MINLKPVTLTILACAIGTGTYIFSTPAQADDAGAFIGGVFATKLISNAKRRADAEEAQAAAVQQHRSAPASTSQSPQERLKQLDKLAAGGYITPEEYKRKKKAIIDSM